MRLRFAILALLLTLSSSPAFSQGCAMCSSTAKATSKDGIRAIAKGVVVLLVPTLTFMSLGNQQQVKRAVDAFRLLHSWRRQASRGEQTQWVNGFLTNCARLSGSGD